MVVHNDAQSAASPPMVGTTMRRVLLLLPWVWDNEGIVLPAHHGVCTVGSMVGILHPWVWESGTPPWVWESGTPPWVCGRREATYPGMWEEGRLPTYPGMYIPVYHPVYTYHTLPGTPCCPPAPGVMTEHVRAVGGAGSWALL